MSRKATILLGSPRRNGNSETLAASFAKGAAEAGFKVQTYRINGLRIGGCIDCRRCWTNGSHCFLNDDMKELYSAIDKSDVIAFVSPLYFFSWSTQIKPVWDRLLPYFSPRSKIDISGRTAVLLATAGDDTEASFDGMRSSFEMACKYAEWKIAGMLLATGLQDAGDVRKSGDWLAKAEKLGRSLQI
jgi:multimeric flavodoxin WrbA